ncbi:hypothetical protein [Ferviditalea candida]|uniref:Uncharacterized protein n=1 Tax=Ferviditalea candida TaxID=3108399 RepID=A0ABU5ZC41_9BACL|nr:hypothetical protein [Paenibacillaceae bacterium T2]
MTTTGHAAPNFKEAAKTPPPPSEFQIQGIFNPNHKYSQDGANSIMWGQDLHIAPPSSKGGIYEEGERYSDYLLMN